LSEPSIKRRQLLTRIVKGFTLVGLAGLTYPFIRSLMPDFSEDLSLEVDITDLQPGEHKIIRWRGKNLLVQRRNKMMLDLITSDQVKLKDPSSAESSQPAFAANPFRSRREDIFVTYLYCTHLGCEVVAADSHQREEGTGFICPCHASDYDLAGRVVKGAPAPLNLEIPNYRYLSRSRILLEPAKEESAV